MFKTEKEFLDYLDSIKKNDEKIEDKELAFEAIDLDIDNINYVSEKLRNDREFMHRILRHEGLDLFKYAGEELKNDKKFIMDSIYFFSWDHDKDTSYILLNVNEKFRDDKDVILAYIKNGYGKKII